MADKKKEQELEERKAKREGKQLSDDDLGTQVSGGSIANVNYEPTQPIDPQIGEKI